MDGSWIFCTRKSFFHTTTSCYYRSEGPTLVVWWLRFKEAHNCGSALGVKGTGRKTLCLVQCLAMQCWRALTRAKQLSIAATSLAPKLHMRSWNVNFYSSRVFVCHLSSPGHLLLFQCMLFVSQMCSTFSSSSFSTCKRSNLFLRVSENWFLVCSSCNLTVLSLFLFGDFLILCLFNFSFSFVLTKWWLLATSAPCIALVSQTEVLCCRDINTLSIWVWVNPFGDVQVCLCPIRWGNMVPVITRLLKAAKLTRRSPLSFIIPIPCFPNISSQPSFELPTFALRSPINTTRSCLGTLSRVAWSCS